MIQPAVGPSKSYRSRISLQGKNRASASRGLICTVGPDQFSREMTESVVDWSGIALACSAELLWVAFCCAAVHSADEREMSVVSRIDRMQLGCIAVRSVVAHLTFFCVHSRSLCVSFAALMPSAKFVRVLAKRARAWAWSARSSRFLALSSPDL